MVVVVVMVVVAVSDGHCGHDGVGTDPRSGLCNFGQARNVLGWEIIIAMTMMMVVVTMIQMVVIIATPHAAASRVSG